MKHIRLFPSVADYDAFMALTPVYPNVSYIEDVGEVRYVKSPPTSTIIINQNLTDPTQIISGEVNGEAIQLIRSNSHRYLGKNTAEGEMTLCQLNDANSTMYADGTAADLTGAEGDVFMRLPRFSYRATEIDADIWQIEFCYAGPMDDTWQEWDGNDLIGVYEAYMESNKLYSRSGVESVGTKRSTDYVAYANNRGKGFSLIKWKHHSMMAFLFYALYGTTDSVSQLGKGASSYGSSAGYTDALGMADTGGSTDHINFWGLENWWGAKGQFLHNAQITNGVISITEDDGKKRTIQSVATSGTIGKMVIGPYLDAACKELGTSKAGFVNDWAPYSTSAVVL